MKIEYKRIYSDGTITFNTTKDLRTIKEYNDMIKFFERNGHIYKYVRTIWGGLENEL